MLIYTPYSYHTHFIAPWFHSRSILILNISIDIIYLSGSIKFVETSYKSLLIKSIPNLDFTYIKQNSVSNFSIFQMSIHNIMFFTFLQKEINEQALTSCTKMTQGIMGCWFTCKLTIFNLLVNRAKWTDFLDMFIFWPAFFTIFESSG